MNFPMSRSGRRRGWALASATALAAAGLVGGVAGPAEAQVACDVDYQAEPWTSGPGAGGFTANITITNLGDPLAGWTLEFTLPPGQSFDQGWSASWSGGSGPLAAESLSWNADLDTGASTTIGFNGQWTGEYVDPTGFTLNQVACAGAVPPDPAVIVAPAALTIPGGQDALITVSLSQAPVGEVTVDLAVAGSSAVSVTPAAVTLDELSWQVGAAVTVLTTPGPETVTATITATAAGYEPATVPVTRVGDDPGERVANPYDGAEVYLDPVWAGRVLDQAAETPGQLGDQMAQVASYPTAVWMDRRGAITDGIGLVGHLDQAVAQQQASNGPLVFQVVIYNLPNRDCAALASNGELRISENGFEIYREEYIDVIAAILARPEYAELRIAAIIEVDSLPNLVTNLNIPDCQEANGPGGYRDGIRYALNRLGTVPNVYSYLDIGHSGWLGWDDNFGAAVNLYHDMLTSPAHFGPPPGLDSVNGLITNSANYTSTVEPFLPDSNLVLPGGGNPIRSANFYEWNPHLEEVSFAQALHAAFSQRGMSGFGMLIDSSRNGWGGPDRPTEVSTATELNTYVDESRVDRRPHRGGWCNQAGAGIGERPTSSPAPAIHAYVWVKPPGESDGISDPDFEPDPNDPNKQHDPMCDPNAQNVYDPQHPTNSLPDAPHAGRWFPEQFAMLVENAFPPIS